MPQITITLTEEEAAALFADNWEKQPVSAIAKNLIQSAAKEYIRTYPESMPAAIERYRELHPSTT